MSRRRLSAVPLGLMNPESKIQNHENVAVVIVNSDDSFLDVQQPRLATAQAQLGHVRLIRRMPPGGRYPLPLSVGAVEERIKAVEAAVKEAGDCKLCII